MIPYLLSYLSFITILIHPAIITFIGVLLLIIFYNNNTIFKIISYFYLFICHFFLLKQKGLISSVTISNHFQIIADYNYYNNIIAFSLLYITGLANMYANYLKNKKEVIYGGLYCTSSLIALYAQDYISLLIGLEMMTIFASILFYLNNSSKSYHSLKRYFLTHLTGGGLILSGFVYIITITENYNIQSLTSMLYNSNIGTSISVSLILIGLLINIAAFPFSGWMIKCYPKAINSSFIYLISFTTKINLVILFKLFSGLSILKSIGIIMMLNGGIYCFIENNLKTIFCYLMLTSLGFILVAISFNTPHILVYTAISIINNSLLAITILTLEYLLDITYTNQLGRIKLYKLSWPLIFYLILTIIMILNLPVIDASTIFKNSIKNHITLDWLNTLIQIINLLIIFSNITIIINTYISKPINDKLNINNLSKKFNDLLIDMLLISVISILSISLIKLIYFSKISILTEAWWLIIQILSILALGLAYWIFSYILFSHFNHSRRISLKFNIDLLYFIYKIYLYLSFPLLSHQVVDNASNCDKTNSFSKLINHINNKQNLNSGIFFSISILILILLSILIN